jgi:peptidylprolyl isomerase
MLKLILSRVGLVTACCLMVACTEATNNQASNSATTPTETATATNVTATPTPAGTVTTTATPTATATPTTTATPGATKTSGKLVTTPSGLKYEVLKPGTGAIPKAGQTITVHYTGTLENGTKFDSSRDRGEPIDFPIGVGQVIPGWDEALTTMKVGERRKLIIPAKLGYGASGTPDGTIPPNATLIFDVELLGVK